MKTPENQGAKASAETAHSFDLGLVISLADFFEEGARRKITEAIVKKSRREEETYSRQTKEYKRAREILESLRSRNLQFEEGALALLEEDINELNTQFKDAHPDQEQELEDEMRATERAVAILEGVGTDRNRPDFKLWQMEKSRRELAEQAKVFGERRQAAEHIRTEQLAEARDTLEKESLFEDIEKQGAASVHMSLPEKYAKSAGYTTLRERRCSNYGDHYFADVYSRFPKHLEDEFEAQGVHEAIVIEPKEIAKSNEIEVPVQEGIIFKKTVIKKERRTEMVPALHSEVVSGGTNEEAYRLLYRTYDGRDNSHYQDYSHRFGQLIVTEIVIPKSLAEKIQSECEKDPTIVRRMVEDVLIKKFKIDRTDWEKGSENTNNIALRPPYEAWRQDAGGVVRVYVKTPRGGEVISKNQRDGT